MSPRKRRNKLKAIAEDLILGVIDVASVLAVFWLALVMRTDVLPLFYPGFPLDQPFRNPLNLWWVMLVWVFFFWYEGLYAKRFSLWDEIEALVKVAFYSTAAMFTIISIGKLSEQVSRTLVVLMGSMAVVLLPLVRVLAKRLLRALGFLRRRVLILGATESGRRIASALKQEPHYGYVVIGFLDDSLENIGTRIDGVKVHRGIDRALAYIRRSNVTDLFIAVPDEEKERVRSLINTLQHKVERVLFVPDMFGIAVLGTSVVHFFQEQVFAFEIQNNLAKPVNFVIKRCFDFLVSSVLLLILALPMLVLALLIRKDAPGPAIFRQQRVGLKGTIFDCFKFRTMYQDAETRLARILEEDPEAKEEFERHWKLKDDPRVTKMGRFLRMTSLDELPQLINVFKGEMSIVGARPYIPQELSLLGDRRDTILLTKPGITGLWQVSGRSTTQYELRIALDSWYVQNWNLWLDIVILFKTLLVVVRKEGAY
jgi:Undecaprenyl-phosphate galactose phosphotransferase WbaP